MMSIAKRESKGRYAPAFMYTRYCDVRIGFAQYIVLRQCFLPSASDHDWLYISLGDVYDLEPCVLDMLLCSQIPCRKLYKGKELKKEWCYCFLGLLRTIVQPCLRAVCF